MSDIAGAFTKSDCRADCVQASPSVRDLPFLKTPKANKLFLENVSTDSPVSELAKDLGELSTSM